MLQELMNCLGKIEESKWFLGYQVSYSLPKGPIWKNGFLCILYRCDHLVYFQLVKQNGESIIIVKKKKQE